MDRGTTVEQHYFLNNRRSDHLAGSIARLTTFRTFLDVLPTLTIILVRLVRRFEGPDLGDEVFVEVVTARFEGLEGA